MININSAFFVAPSRSRCGCVQLATPLDICDAIVPRPDESPAEPSPPHPSLPLPSLPPRSIFPRRQQRKRHSQQVHYEVVEREVLLPYRQDGCEREQLWLSEIDRLPQTCNCFALAASRPLAGTGVPVSSPLATAALEWMFPPRSCYML